MAVTRVQLVSNVIGVSTFPSSQVIIGSGTSTGTANQPLQVTGGAYISTNTGIGTTNPLYTLSVTNSGTTPVSGLTNCLIDATSNTNSYSQINIRNASTGTSASADVIVTADNGTDSTNFVDLGINNSGYSVGTWTINGANDGYLYASDGNFAVGVVSTTKALTFFAGGTLAANEKLRVNNTGVGIGTTNPLSTLQVGTAITMYGSTGIISATKYFGDGSSLTGVSAGLSLRQAGAVVAGGAATTVNFASGATITSVSAGVATVTIAAGIQTEALTGSASVISLDLSKQDHKVTATGITTITVSGGTEGDSHTVRIVNSGIATIGFSTYFLFPSGSPPVLPTTSGAISLLSFTVHRVGTAGTQLLAGASLNFS